MSELHFISFPEDLPVELPTEDPKIIDDLATLKRLMKSPVVNLEGITNTELKRLYGAENFDYLSLADQRYASLIRVLLRLSSACSRNSFLMEEEKYLLFALDTGTDCYEIWASLADNYYYTGDREGIAALVKRAKDLPDERFGRIKKMLDSMNDLTMITS